MISRNVFYILLQKNEQDWSNFVSFRELQMSRSSTEIDIVNQTSQNIEALLQKTERAIQSAKALQKLFKLSNEVSALSPLYNKFTI